MNYHAKYLKYKNKYLSNNPSKKTEQFTNELRSLLLLSTDPKSFSFIVKQQITDKTLHERIDTNLNKLNMNIIKKLIFSEAKNLGDIFEDKDFINDFKETLEMSIEEGVLLNSQLYNELLKDTSIDNDEIPEMMGGGKKGNRFRRNKKKTKKKNTPKPTRSTDVSTPEPTRSTDVGTPEPTRLTDVGILIKSLLFSAVSGTLAILPQITKSAQKAVGTALTTTTKKVITTASGLLGVAREASKIVTDTVSLFVKDQLMITDTQVKKIDESDWLINTEKQTKILTKLRSKGPYTILSRLIFVSLIPFYNILAGLKSAKTRKVALIFLYSRIILPLIAMSLTAHMTRQSIDPDRVTKLIIPIASHVASYIPPVGISFIDSFKDNINSMVVAGTNSLINSQIVTPMTDVLFDLPPDLLGLNQVFSPLSIAMGSGKNPSLSSVLLPLGKVAGEIPYFFIKDASLEDDKVEDASLELEDDKVEDI